MAASALTGSTRSIEPFFLARPALPWRAFSACGHDFLATAATPWQPWPERQAVATRANVGQAWRNSGQTPQQPQLRRPVCQCPAQPFQIRMPCPDLGFAGRDLLAAAADSCGFLSAFVSHIVERPPVPVELGLLSGQRLPPLHDHVHILGI